MTLRQYLLVMSLGTTVAISSWCLVLISINPFNAGTLIFIAFYVTLAMGLAGLFTIIGTAVRAARTQTDNVGPLVARSLRQAMLLTLLVVGSLYLMTLGVFSTLTLFIAVAALGFLEFFFLISSKEDEQVDRFS